MLFQIDRVQYLNDKNKYLLTEFFKVDDEDIEYILYKLDRDELELHHFTNVLNDIDSEKFEFLCEVFGESIVNLDLLFYSEVVENDEVKYRNKIIVLNVDNTQMTKFNIYVYDYNDYKKYFRENNNLNKGESKVLGMAKDDEDKNNDYFINRILENIYDIEDYSDDCGLEITKALLGDDKTKGFDLDLYQYIESTEEHIFYEFLRRKNKYVDNINAHPMRYCWTGGYKDNKTKFINLWKLKENLNGRLFLINYSDNIDEKISIIEVTSLDDRTGIKSEKKYVMTYKEFLEWLQSMNSYNNSNNNYLENFKEVIYDKDFFDNWNKNKSKYGKEFK